MSTPPSFGSSVIRRLAKTSLVFKEPGWFWKPLHGWPPSDEVGSACRGTYKPIPDGYSDDLQRLVGVLLQKDPRARPTAATVLVQPYVRRHVQVPAPASAPPVLAGHTAFSASMQMFPPHRSLRIT